MRPALCEFIFLLQISLILTQNFNATDDINNILDILIKQSEYGNENNQLNDQLNKVFKINNNTNVYLESDLYSHLMNVRRTNTPHDIDDRGYTQTDYDEEIIVEIEDTAKEASGENPHGKQREEIKTLDKITTSIDKGLRSGNNVEAERTSITYFPKNNDMVNILYEYPKIDDGQFSNQHKQINSLINDMFSLPSIRNNEYPLKIDIRDENLELEGKTKEGLASEAFENVQPLILRTNIPDNYNNNPLEKYYRPLKQSIHTFYTPPINPVYELKLTPPNLFTEILGNQAKYKQQFDPYYVSNMVASPKNVIRTVIHHQGIAYYPPNIHASEGEWWTDNYY